MLEDVAVIKVSARIAVEADDDAGDRGGGTVDGVLPALFIEVGRGSRREIACSLIILIFEDVEDTAIENLEANEMQVHGVGVFGEVDELPDLGGVELWGFGDGLVPMLVVEQHEHGVADFVEVFVEGNRACDCGGRFGDPVYGA